MSATDPNVQKVIEVLNKARAMEIQAIHQYMIQHYIMDDLDYGQLCAYLKLISIDEMRHAEKFAERIETLGGKPTCDKAGPIVQPQTVQEIYPFDENMEHNTIVSYDQFAKTCLECDDTITAGIFHQIIDQENIHLAYYTETKEHIKILGDAFLAKYAATSKHTGPIKSFVKVMEKEEF